jgi:hypothetical protein
MLRLPCTTIDDIITQEHAGMTYFNVKNAKPARNLHELKKFGGKLSIQEWRDMNQKVTIVEPKKQSKKVEIPNSIYEKDIKAEAMIFGKCLKDDRPTKAESCYGLQKYLLNV